MTGPREPLAARLLRRLAPPDWRDSMAGDLEEARARRRAAGRRAGAIWSVAAALALVLPLVVDRWRARRSGPGAERRRLMHGFMGDVRQAWRGLAAHRGYAATAIATLAIGIGANASVFNLANWLLYRDVPGIAREESLVTIGYGRENARGPISMIEFDRLAAGTPALERFAGYQGFPLHVSTAGATAERIDAEVVTAAYFDVLGGPFTLGRGFTAAEGRDPGQSPVAVISHRLWTRALSARTDAIGTSLAVNGRSFSVIGVTARGFHGASRAGSAEMWVPIAQHRVLMPSYPDNLLTSRTTRVLFGLVGRLSPDATIEQVTAQIDATRAAMSAEFPTDRRLQTWRFDVRPGIEARPWVTTMVGSAVRLLAGFVGLLLVLASANMASLMIARAAGRRAEVAARLALGATRWRVARLLLVESVLLSVAAGGVAVAVAWVAGRLFEGTRAFRGLPPLDRLGIDWPVIGFAFAVSTTVAVVAGLWPAVGGSRVRVSAAMGDAGRGFTPSRQRLRRALTTVQVALSLVLLVGAALLARSIGEKLALDPGFDDRQVLTFSVEPGLQGYPRGADPFYRDLLARLGDVPGVRRAGLVWLQPFSQGAADTAFTPEGVADEVSAHANMVSPGFFDAAGIPLVSGRDFTAGEFLRRSGPSDGVAIVTESLARRIFGGAPAVGRRLTMSYPEGHTRTIVGVAGDTRLRHITDAEGTVFEPFGQTYSSGWASVLVGLSAPVAEVLPAIRERVASLDPNLPVYDVMRLDDAVRRQLADDLLVSRLAVVFSVLAMVLSAIGLYGVLARGVVERRREMGIRMALGSTPAGVATLVGREAAWMVAAGVAIGLPASWFAARLVESRLFGISRLDGLSIGAALAVVAFVAVASALPAMRRAARGDAISSLRA